MIHTSTMTLALLTFEMDWPLVITLASSILVGLGMVVLFGYASNQKAIKRAKDQIQANLLAVRLFQDQLGAVLRSYLGILTSLGRYLRLSFAPLLIVIVPLTFLILQMDRFLGSTPLPAGQPFLVKARLASADALNDVALRLPAGAGDATDAVHVPASHEVIWRVPGLAAGAQTLQVESGGQSVAKLVVVGEGVARLSAIRMQGPWWKRVLDSAEPAIDAGAAVQSVEVLYPARSIAIFGFGMNWILWFFVFSMIAGFLFKSLLGIEI